MALRWLFGLWLLVAALADARPYTVDDMLKVEQFGQVSIARRAGLLLFERVRSYGSATDYSLHYFARRQLTSLMAVDLARDAPPFPLFAHDPGAGYWMAGLSPSARRLAVYRISGGVLSLGVVDLRNRSVRWLQQSPDLPTQSPRPIWAGEGHLVFVAMPRARLPFLMSLGRAEREEKTRLWKLQSEGRRPSAIYASSEAGPEYDHSKRELVYVDIASGRSRVLMRGDVVDVSANPDATHFAVMTAGRPLKPPAGPVSISFASRRNAIQIVDLKGGSARVDCGSAFTGTMSWSSSGDRLLSLVEGVPGRSEQRRYMQIDRLGQCVQGSSSAASSSQGSRQLIGRAWLGQTPTLLIRGTDGSQRWVIQEGAGERALAVGSAARVVGTLRGAVLMLEGTRLMHVTARGSTLVASDVTSVDVPTRDPFAVGIRPASTPDRISFFTVRKGTDSYLVPLTENGVAGLPERLDARSAVVAADGGDRVFIDRSASGEESLRLQRSGAATRRVDSVNVHLRDADPLDFRRLTVIDAGGVPVTSWLYLPPGRAPHPLIVIPYSGQTFGNDPPAGDAPEQVGQMDNARFLLAAGYAVLRPGMPPARDPLSRLAVITDQVDAAVSEAAATGLIDVRRVGLLGHSFGGYSALAVASRSSRYRAIVAANAPYDLAFEHGSLSGAESMRMETGIPFAHPAWVEDGQGAMGKPPDPRDAAAWIAASPRWWLKDVTAPVLLVGADLDSVGIDQAEGAFLEMTRLGKQVSLLRYYGEGHALYSPANLRDYYGRVVRFFAALLGELEPDAPRRSGSAQPPAPRVTSRHGARPRR